MSFYTIFNITSEFWGLLLCITCLICTMQVYTENLRIRQNFLYLFLCDSVELAADITGYISKNVPGATAHFVTVCANTVVFFCSYMLLILLTKFVADEIRSVTGHRLRIVWFNYTLCMIGILLDAVNLIRPVYFYVAEDNSYHRADFFWVSMMVGILISLVNEVLVIYWRKRIYHTMVICFSLYTVLPIFAMVIQTFFYGIAILNMCTTLLLMICFIATMGEINRMISRQKMAIAQKENELTENRTQIMLSQIQPHFLYNSLNSIYYLCGKDPKTAQKAVGDFSNYIRMNLDALKTRENIPFEKELEHIETYLWLEKLRFDDRLNVVYDIQFRDFMLPVLTIQPLVENAVKHGVCRKPQGGTVILRTELQDNDVIITVADDGVGFDPSVKKQDGRSHIGLQNVRNRIESEIGGTLTIDSRPGEGTTITVRIPGM